MNTNTNTNTNANTDTNTTTLKRGTFFWGGGRTYPMKQLEEVLCAQLEDKPLPTPRWSETPKSNE
jgi:hypothetical protein